MKIIHRLIRLLPGGPTKIKPLEQPVPGNAEKPSAEPEQKPARSPFAEDDSPPGYKVRWHH
jgi:hypothetical protein